MTPMHRLVAVLAVLLAVVLPVAAFADAPVPGDPSTITATTPPVIQVMPDGDLIIKPVLPAVTIATSARHAEASFAAVKWLRGRVIAYHKLTVRWASAMGRSIPSLKRQLSSERGIPVLKRQVVLWKHRAAVAHHQFKQVLGNRGYLAPSQARVLGKWLAARIYHWTGPQWSCLDAIWGSTSKYGTLESGWDVLADNPHSDAYGIPQALPGSKMRSAGANWLKSAYVQIVWGLGYIKRGFHTPCGALSVRLKIGSY